MFYVDLPIDTQVTSELSPITDRLLFMHKTIGYLHQNKIKIGKKAFRHFAECLCWIRHFAHT